MHIRPASRPIAAPDMKFGYQRLANGYLRWAEGRAFLSVRDETRGCAPANLLSQKGEDGGKNKKFRPKQLVC